MNGLLSDENHPLILLGSANIGLEAVRKGVDALMPVLSALVLVGQVAVAVVTVVYIVRKTHLLGKRKRRAIKKALDETKLNPGD